MATPFPFTTGQVLTAAQMNAITELVINDKTDSYTLVAGDAGERVVMNKATSSTITVPNSVFTAGQVVYIVNKGAGVCTVTAGAGTTVSTTGSLALAQYGSGTLLALSASAFIFEASGVAQTAAGLTLISSTTIGTAVASVTVSSAFSSTYDNYKITVSGGASSTGTGLNLVLGSTATGYYGAQNYTRVDTGAVSTDGRNNTTSFVNAGVGNTNGLLMNIDLFSPNLAEETSYHGWYLVQQTNGSFGYTGGWVNDTTQYTAFTISTGSGTMTGGTIRVYGYKNS